MTTPSMASEATCDRMKEGTMNVNVDDPNALDHRLSALRRTVTDKAAASDETSY